MSSETHVKEIHGDEPDLKSIRESRGLTLKDIYKSTRISITNLAAIEHSDFHLLPPPVFTKSFIKIYAKTIGVESSSTLARYEQYLQMQGSTHKEVDIKQPPAGVRINYRRIVPAFVLIAFAVSAAFFYLSQKPSIDVIQEKPVDSAPALPPTPATNDTPTDTQNNTSPPPDSSKKTEEEALHTTASPAVQQPSQEAPRKPDMQSKDVVISQSIISTHKETKGQYPLIMVARELTWIRIRTDHNPPYEILLKPGEKIERSASQFMIDIGNAGGVAVEFQGNSLGSLGKQGEVVHLTLP